MKKRMKLNPFLFFGFFCSALLAFGGALDTIEGMSPGLTPVKYLSVLFALVFFGAGQAFGDGGESYVVAPFENTSPVKQLDWMSSALAMTVAEKLEALQQVRPAYGAQIIDGYE